MNPSEHDMQVVQRLSSIETTLQSIDSQLLPRVNNHADRIGRLERWRSYSYGIYAGVAGVLAALAWVINTINK